MEFMFHHNIVSLNTHKFSKNHKHQAKKVTYFHSSIQILSLSKCDHFLKNLATKTSQKPWQTWPPPKMPKPNRAPNAFSLHFLSFLTLASLVNQPTSRPKICRKRPKIPQRPCQYLPKNSKKKSRVWKNASPEENPSTLVVVHVLGKGPLDRVVLFVEHVAAHLHLGSRLFSSIRRLDSELIRPDNWHAGHYHTPRTCSPWHIDTGKIFALIRDPLSRRRWRLYRAAKNRRFRAAKHFPSLRSQSFTRFRSEFG